MPHQCTDCGRGFEDGSKEMLSGCPNCGGTTFQFQPEGIDEETTDQPPEPPEPPESEVDSTVARTVGSAATAVRDLVGGPSRGSDTDHDRGEQSSVSSGTEPQSTPSLESQQESSTAVDSSPPEPSVSGGDAGQTSRDESFSDPSSSSGTSRPGTDSTQESAASSASPTKSSGSSGITADTQSNEDTAQADARSDVIEPDDLPPAPESSTRDQPASPTGKDEPETEDDPDLEELREQLNKQFESIRVLAPGQYELNLMELYDREEYIIALQEDGKYTIQVPERWGE
jgi:predicted  nucleic acid-binding Zn-ribbon protein